MAPPQQSRRARPALEDVEVIAPKVRQARRIRSAGRPSKLIAAPIREDRDEADWDAPGTQVTARLITDRDDVAVFDVTVEGTDDTTGPGRWYTLVAATGMRASGVTRDGSPYVPTIACQSTKVTAKRLRVSVKPSKAIRFGARIEVT